MIVYIGNMMSKHGGSVGVIETLTRRFSERHTVVAVSDKKNQVLRLVHMLFTIYRYRRQCTLVLIDSYSTLAFWYAWLAAWLCRRLGIGYVPILHGGEFPSRLQRSPRSCRRLFGGAFINVSPSHYLQQAFQQHGQRVVYIPNSIDMAAYTFRQRQQLRPRLLWVRSFHAIYNPVLAVQVLVLLIQKYPDAELCMVGGDKDGSLAAVKRAATELGVANRISFPGFLSKKEWTEKAAGYDIFINTTNADNHPVSLIEAMALGLPVISTNPGGVPFLVTHETDGWLVPVNDATAMCNAIINLLMHPEISSTLSKNARLKAETFSWDVVQHSWWQLLDGRLPD